MLEIVQDVFLNKNEIKIFKNKKLQLKIYMEQVVLYQAL